MFKKLLGTDKPITTKKPITSNKTAESPATAQADVNPDELVSHVRKIAQDNPELTVQLLKTWMKEDS